MLDAIERFANDGTFVAVEAAPVGPGWRWRGGLPQSRGDTHLIGIEASPARFALMCGILRLTSSISHGVTVELFEGAVSHDEGLLPDGAVGTWAPPRCTDGSDMDPRSADGYARGAPLAAGQGVRARSGLFTY